MRDQHFPGKSSMDFNTNFLPWIWSHSKNQGWAISTSFAYNASFTKSANRPRTQLDLEDWLTHSHITVGVFLLVEWNAIVQHAWLRHLECLLVCAALQRPVSIKACRRLWMLQPGYLINRAHQRVVSFSALQLKQVSLWGRNPPWNISTAIVSVRRTHLRIVFSIRKGQGKIEMRQIQGAYRKERHVAVVLNW